MGFYQRISYESLGSVPSSRLCRRGGFLRHESGSQVPGPVQLRLHDGGRRQGGLGWVYYNGHCYLFTSYHETYLNAEERCNEHGAYLADVLDQAENDFIKSVLRAV